VYVISEGILQRHYKTEFVGNTFVSGERLKALIQSKPGWFYFIKGVVDRQQIEGDVERLTTYYRNFGFFSARVSRELAFDESGKWLTLRFVIDEGPRYVVRHVTVEGNEKFTKDSLMEQLGLTGGQYFDLGKMNRDVNSLRDAYGAEGHIFADIVAEPRFLETPGELDLVYDIQEGEMFRVGKINVHITGEHPHTRRNVVLNRLSLYPGDINDLREVRASERRLKHSQLFENNPATGTTPKIVIRPPELKDIESLASPPGRTVRGQSPDDSRR
jgi:outer membrane protein insertion porin family